MRPSDYARINDGKRPKPNAILQNNRSGDQVERRFFIVMAARKKGNTLRDANIIADGHRDKAVDPNILANPHLIANGKPPGIFDIYIGFNFNLAADFSPE